jgi:hypothetical protein
MVPRPFRVLARAPGDVRACESRTTKTFPSVGRSPQGGSVPSFARSERARRAAHRGHISQRRAVTARGPRPACRFDLLPPCTPITARQRTRRACATSRPAWASPSAAPTASSPTWPRPATSSSRKTAAATATRSRHTCRCQNPPGGNAPSAKSRPSWPEPAPGRGRRWADAPGAATDQARCHRKPAAS